MGRVIIEHINNSVRVLRFTLKLCKSWTTQVSRASLPTMTVTLGTGSGNHGRLESETIPRFREKSISHFLHTNYSARMYILYIYSYNICMAAAAKLYSLKIDRQYFFLSFGDFAVKHYLCANFVFYNKCFT